MRARYVCCKWEEVRGAGEEEESGGEAGSE